MEGDRIPLPGGFSPCKKGRGHLIDLTNRDHPHDPGGLVIESILSVMDFTIQEIVGEPMITVTRPSSSAPVTSSTPVLMGTPTACS